MTSCRITHFSANTVALSALVSLVGLTGSVLAAEDPAMPAQSAGSANQPTAATAAQMRNVERDERHIKELHDRLKITPAQETLWAKVAEVMRSNDDTIDKLSEERHERAATMTAVEDLRSFAAITEAHAAGSRNFIPAFEALYQAMPAEQQANADRVFRETDHKAHKKAK